MTKPNRPMRDLLIEIANEQGCRRVEALKFMTAGERAGLFFEAGYPRFLVAMAEVREGKREPLDSIIERGIAHAQLARDYNAAVLDAEQVDAVLNAIPADTELVLS